ncbi:putative nucleotidyltransferase, ribonuclease H [Tanacetum coccineum]
MDQLMNRCGNRNSRGTDDEKSETLFGKDDDSSPDEQSRRRPRHIMDSVNMFDPMTLSDAYQRALAFEKLNHRVGSSSSPAIIGASGSGNVASRFAPSQAKAGGGNIGPSECKKAGKRHLFADLEGDDDAAYEEYEEATVYDEQYEDSFFKMEYGMRVNIPDFAGDTLSPEGFIDWLVAVEEVFEFKEVPENKRVSLIATKLRGRASAWWKQLKLTKERVGKPRIMSWQKIKKCMKDNFIPHNYQRQMYQRLQNLKQGSKSIEDYTTEFYQFIARNDIQETEDQLVSRYIGGLRVQIMDSVNMFDPMTLSDAYQRALAFKKLNRRVGSSSYPAIIGDSGSGNVASRFIPSLAKAGGGNTGPVSRASGSSGLKCFNCGKPGLRQSECKKAGKRHVFANSKGSDDAAYEEYEEAPVYDEELECEEEFVSGDVGVNLVVRHSCLTPKADGDDWLKHNIFQSTCTISCKWLKKGGEVTVSKRVHVPFSVGNTYKDNVWCDVVPMDACHLLLGRPWEYDRDITHNGRTNTYSFLFEGLNITLMPNKPKEVVSKPTGTLLTLSQFEDELEIGDDVIVLIGKEVAEDSEIPEAMIPLLEEFSDVFPDELPDGLPPLRDIQHHIDLEPGSLLLNRPHYRMSPREHEELRRQVEELVSKGHVRESMSPCAVPALLNPKKDGTWRMCVDSRAINKITMRYMFPIPHLDDLLDQISGATIFTKLDLKSGYYHIRHRPDAEWKTAFKTREGLYE